MWGIQVSFESSITPRYFRQSALFKLHWSMCIQFDELAVNLILALWNMMKYDFCTFSESLLDFNQMTRRDSSVFSVS